MCGISAIAGRQNVAACLLQNLKNLEYRGYDSCGMALFKDGEITARKNTGTVGEVDEKERFVELEGITGIAHTRWATHGGVTSENSHPHLSNDSHFAIVHNGILSNYQSLRAKLEEKGFKFYSDTDTEVFVNLLQHYYNTNPELGVEKNFVEAVKEIEGSYAIAMITTHQPGTIYAVKQDSPLVLGLNDGKNFLSSDINAFIAETKDVILLEDQEYVVMDSTSYSIRRVADHKNIERDPIIVDWDQETAQKGGYSHYMIKEIFDQPQTIRNGILIDDDNFKAVVNKFLEKPQSFLVGVGTTYFVAMMGTYLFSNFAGLYTPAISADEFSSLIPANEDQHVLYLSQSGETYDTKMAIKHAQSNGAATSAIVNVVGSSISQMVDDCVFQASGPEICVVSTKAAVSQVIIIYRLALAVGLANGHIKQKEYDKYSNELEQFPQIVETVLNEDSGFIRQLAQETSSVDNWLFMGKGIYYPVSMESALKMKEVTYLHAEGLPAGFLKHGTLAMIDESVYSLFFLPTKEDKKLYESTLMAIEEVKARKGKVIGFCSENDKEAINLLDHYFRLPEISKELMPFMELIIIQLFSYYSALSLKRSIDKPRNLAKSVTVG